MPGNYTSAHCPVFCCGEIAQWVVWGYLLQDAKEEDFYNIVMFNGERYYKVQWKMQQVGKVETGMP